MKEIILEKRYPHSREEDITDAFMRGYEIGKEQEHRWWSTFCANCKDENSSEKPNNSLDKDTNVRSKYDCETCKWGDWYRNGYDITTMDDECGGCCSWNSKWTPKTEPQTDPCDGCVCDDGKHLMYCMNCKGIAWKTEPPKVEDEPQTERSE